ncbi:YfaZ family outer membrane protein [Marinomonas posidonica]|uniref:YfaZ family protein n=1 Tax=Marinomonas posidonica (strain CECT 7376 / NCIMB 14433 / IVIA-Po-181) TaxID=491952 RepID=F6D022_MARPP|nr:YfaZ family outer membrane protein [Marinomonas posidonica]AEF54762.1 hypothetical protein Mar181_1724 [Marinomonas posidonica IVIA-Po-181]
MNLNIKTVFLAFGLLGSTIAGASTAGVNLTNETVQGNVNLDMGSFGIGAGLSHDKDESTSTGYLGLSVQDSEGGGGPLEIGIGVRLYAIDAELENDDDELSLALTLGGWYRYTLQQANRISLYGSVYYSPEVLSFTNLNHMYTYDFRLEYMTMRNARAYLKYGNTVIVYENGSRKETNKGVSIGATVDF